MKICFVSHDSGVQGAERALLDLVVNLKRDEKYCLHVILPSSKGGLCEKLKSNGIEVSIIPYYYWVSGRQKNVLKEVAKSMVNVISIFRLVMRFKKIRPDLVYSNSISINVAALSSFVLRLPHIWHFHEIIDKKSEYDFTYGSRFSFWLIGKLCTNIIVVSDFLKEFYSYNLPLCNIIRLYQPVEIYQYQCLRNVHEKYLIRHDVVNCAVIGAVTKVKRQEDAIRATNIVNRNGLNINLWIVGECDGGYCEEMMSLVHDFGLVDVVSFIGYVDNVNDFIKNMDIVISCSVSEGFGRVIIESNLESVPVIGANSGATPEIIENDVTGLLYAPKDEVDLSKKIKQLVNDVDLRIKLGVTGKERAIRNFSSLGYMNKMDNLFQMTLICRK
ncbi:MAG: glycosyltransferase [Gammaproteobacteria bacterium]|nr:glycosyltransferase [Gammaproteobacteria bacterium]